MTDKTYEEMTPEERDRRNRAAFTWKDGDLLFLDPNTGEWLSGGEFKGATGRPSKPAGWLKGRHEASA